MIEKEKKWYALYTRYRHEKRVEYQLKQKGIETYLPMRRILRQWSDRKKWIAEPLFRCYVFVCTDTIGRFEAIQSHGAVRIISFGGKPAIVEEKEIEYIKSILSEFPNAKSYNKIPVGTRVKICRGPLAGVEGILTELRNKNRMIVFLDSINRGVYFNVDVQDVSKVG